MTSTHNPGSPSEFGHPTLTLLLSRLGFKPVGHAGADRLYFNVLQSTDTKPCFAVNEQLDVWYDHNIKKGGNLMDFGLAYWQGLTIGAIQSKIIEMCSIPPATIVLSPEKKMRRRKAQKIPHYHIQETRPLGCNAEITSYLQNLGIWEMAIGHMKEVYYYVVDEKRRRKDFFAAGWSNENGGWEVRGRNFTGHLGNKGMTFIPGDENRLLMFDEYFTYLDWKYEHGQQRPNILIVNHWEFIPAAKRRAEKFNNVTFLPSKEFPGLNPITGSKKS